MSGKREGTQDLLSPILIALTNVLGCVGGTCVSYWISYGHSSKLTLREFSLACVNL
jgi:membrane protein YqaA with SNARE-associated domain